MKMSEKTKEIIGKDRDTKGKLQNIRESLHACLCFRILREFM